VYTAAVFITLSDTDAAGVVYFASVLRLAHSALEAFFDEQGLDLLQVDQALFPIVHCEADYRRPMRRGDHLTCTVSCPEIAPSRFSIAYRFTQANGEVAATARTIHAAVDRERFVSCALPQRMVAVLQPLQAVETSAG